MEKAKFEKIFDGYYATYNKILSSIYPAKNSTGFPERNLSVNFTKAYEALYSDDGCFTWYELQFGEKNNLHYDACLIDDKNKRLFVVESKRFDNPVDKLEEVSKDIGRINQVTDIIDDDLIKRIPNIMSYNIYGVILTDAWEETEKKKEIINSFKNKSFVDDYFYDFSGKLKNLEYFSANGFPRTDGKYYLLSFVWKIK